MELKERLINFEKEYIRGVGVETISSRFQELAKAILYGGYIDVYGEFYIYAKTVEFYFHEEGDDAVIKDPIVYHRNGNYGKFMPNPPFFPMMSLHAHMSGFDITFESVDGNYRASALIRKYSIYKPDGTAIVENATQSTYLYYYLNGFSLNGEKMIKWQDVEYDPKSSLKPATHRKNVYKGDKWQGVRELYDYKWSFSACD